MRSANYWHLIVYDIRCPRRLRRVHAFLKKQAYALQESVFAWQGTEQELIELQQGLLERINSKEDDVRGYRLPANQKLHLFGVSPFLDDVYDFGLPPHELQPLGLLEDDEWLGKMFYRTQRVNQAA